MRRKTEHREWRHVPDFRYPYVLGIHCYTPLVFQSIGKNIQIDSQFSGKPFQFTKLQMLLNALEAFIHELLCAGGDCAQQAYRSRSRPSL